MLDRRMPDYWEDRKAHKERYDALLREGKIGEPTYLLSLEILGFRPREAKEELNYVRAK